MKRFRYCSALIFLWLLGSRSQSLVLLDPVKAAFYILAGLDSADHGSVHVAGEDMGAAHADKRAQIRREKMGFVYQQHHLLAEFSAVENVAIPQRLLA